MLAAKAINQFKKDGYFVIPGVIDVVLNRRLGAFVGGLETGGAGSRGLLNEAWCAHLAGALRGEARIHSLLPRNAVAVQCTFFDNSPSKNWLVALHQDLSIPVMDRVDDPECSGWSEKEGHLYVQPPVKLLEQLVAVRVHIEDCPAESGALRVVPKSHVEGRLSRERAEALRQQYGEDCRASGSRRRFGDAAVAAACVVQGHVADLKACAAFCVRAADATVRTRMAMGNLAKLGFEAGAVQERELMIKAARI